MDESSASRTASIPAEFDRIREVLDRVVRKVCPAWLSAQRDDLVQSACLRIVKRWRGSEERERLATSYLWKVVHSTVMDEIRHRRRTPEVSWDDSVVHGSHLPTASPEASRRAELREVIQVGLGLLDPSPRRTVLLYLHGFTLEESARILGWKRKRVDNQRYLGLRQLRTYLKDRGFGP